MGAVLLISGVHGFALALALTWFGDPQPAHDGRRTPNPFSHLSLVGSFALLLYGLGWIRPIPVDPGELRHARRNLLLVAVCGYGALIALALLSFHLRPVPLSLLSSGTGIAIASFLDTTSRLAIWVLLFNLIPLPPLTGRYLLYSLLPHKIVLRSERISTYFEVGLAILIVTNVATGLLVPILRSISTWFQSHL